MVFMLFNDLNTTSNVAQNEEREMQTSKSLNNLAAKHAKGKGGAHQDNTPEWQRRKEKAAFKKQVKQLRNSRKNQGWEI